MRGGNHLVGRGLDEGDSLNGDPCYTKIVSYRDVDNAHVKIMYSCQLDTEEQPDDALGPEDVPDEPPGFRRSIVLYSGGEVVNSYDFEGGGTIPDMENLRQLLRPFVEEKASAEELDSVLCAMMQARVVALNPDLEDVYYLGSE